MNENESSRRGPERGADSSANGFPYRDGAKSEFFSAGHRRLKRKNE